MWKEKDVVRWSEEGSEVPDRTAVRNALGPDTKAVAAAAEEMNSAEELRSAAAAHAHVRARAHVNYSRVYSYAAIQVRAAGGFVGAGDRGGEAQGTTTREFAGMIRIQMRTRVRRAMAAMMVKAMMMMSAETEVFRC
jgi:hypothetical protein